MIKNIIWNYDCVSCNKVIWGEGDKLSSSISPSGMFLILQQLDNLNHNADVTVIMAIKL